MSVFADGERVGRFVTLRDADGVQHAIAASSVMAITESDGICFMAMPGGRVIRVEHPMASVLSWFEVSGIQK